ncbi:ribosomal protein L7/L12 [Microbacterium arabinogalactanolyticum]|uniref:ribosomal protein L7/L12 n=1 Tax=Microbacterium arabinogalactanolyticum TaxID=69365 RepID=UPI00404479BE
MEPWMWIVAVVVLLVLVPWATKGMRPKAPQPPHPPASVAPRALSPAESAEIDALVAGDRKIAAIKRLRELQSLGLQEAKDAIDAWVPGTTWTPAAAASASASASASAPGDALTPAARAEIAALIADDEKIRAIKRYREETGVGLKQAKDAVENW